jgi:hypothetical protein
MYFAVGLRILFLADLLPCETSVYEEFLLEVLWYKGRSLDATGLYHYSIAFVSCNFSGLFLPLYSIGVVEIQKAHCLLRGARSRLRHAHAPL